MEDKRIEFETAKLAKEKGLCDYFEYGTEYVPAFYSENEVDYEETEFQQEDCVILDRYLRTTQSLLAKWLRDYHNIEIFVLPVLSEDSEILKYSYTIYRTNREVPENYEVYMDNDTYEEALEIALAEGLKLIKL